MKDFVGQQIDRYHISERLGMGGMAVVYQAFDTRLERDVAVKIIRTEAIPQEQHERLLKRFEREAKSQARFDHKHIVHVYDYGEVDGAPYLVMAYIPGGTLKARTGKPIAYPQVIHWLIPVADALSYAHKRGVIHRDIKPSNILFDDEDQPILTDFGIAKLLETDDVTLTGTGLGVGTPEYMAPEQWQGQASPATDQYALGVVLYELLTGQKPYMADTPVAVALLQMSEPLRSPRSLVPGIPEPVEKLLYKALARAPQDRYEDMTTFRNALEKQLAWHVSELGKPREEVNTPVSAPAIPSLPGIGSEAETVDALEPTPADLPQPKATRQAGTRHVNGNQKRTRLPAWVRWSMGAALLVIGMVVGISLLGRDRGGTPAAAAEPTEAALALVDTPVPTATDIPAPTATETPLPSQTATKTGTATRMPTTTPTSEPTLGIGSTMVNPADGALMVYVPGGEFTMGSEDEDAYSDEAPEHQVWLDAFWIYQTEVTNQEYRVCVEEGACNQPWNSPNYKNLDYVDHPVVGVLWNQASAYCEWAGGRLPTEAEWEKAARGTDGRKYPWGDDPPTCSLANYWGCVGGTSPVGSYPDGVSPYGALDMAGNVWEWVADWFDADYYSRSDYENPIGPQDGDYRVVRGGSVYLGGGLRVSDRFYLHPYRYDGRLGFRCLRSPEP